MKSLLLREEQYDESETMGEAIIDRLNEISHRKNHHPLGRHEIEKQQQQKFVELNQVNDDWKIVNMLKDQQDKKRHE